MNPILNYNAAKTLCETLEQAITFAPEGSLSSPSAAGPDLAAHYLIGKEN